MSLGAIIDSDEDDEVTLEDFKIENLEFQGIIKILDGGSYLSGQELQLEVTPTESHAGK